MAANSFWISYDAQSMQAQRRTRRLPWLLLPILLLVLLALGWVWSEQPGGVDLVRPMSIQAALPSLLIDNVSVIYVVDDSESMQNKLSPLHEALRAMARKHTDNTEIAVLQFGETHALLFDFVDPSSAPWDDAIPAFTAGSGRTAMYLALQRAMEVFPQAQDCHVQARWMVFEQTVCRENRIVLMSDGQAGDTQFAEATITDLVYSGIPVDTVAFGSNADARTLRIISNATGGNFLRAYY